MAETAGGWLSVFLSSHRVISLWLAWAFLQHGSLSVVELFTWDWLPREKVEASRPLKAKLRTSTVSLLPHSVGQSQSQG